MHGQRCYCSACDAAREREEQRIASHNTPSKRRYQGPKQALTTDLLLKLADSRKAPRKSAAHSLTYLPLRQRAMRPVLGQLRMIECAIQMSVQMEATLISWRTAA